LTHGSGGHRNSSIPQSCAEIYLITHLHRVLLYR
jgi:hypothetical protein